MKFRRVLSPHFYEMHCLRDSKNISTVMVLVIHLVVYNSQQLTSPLWVSFLTSSYNCFIWCWLLGNCMTAMNQLLVTVITSHLRLFKSRWTVGLATSQNIFFFYWQRRVLCQKLWFHKRPVIFAFSTCLPVNCKLNESLTWSLSTYCEIARLLLLTSLLKCPGFLRKDNS